MELKLKIIHPKLGVDWKLPSYAHQGDVGMDLVAALDEEVVIYAGTRKLVSAGFSMEIPEGFEAQIRPRSGLALKHGITVLNSPGTIDAGYRGEIGVVLINTDQNQAFTVKPGDRIAQMVINRVEIANLVVVSSLKDTERQAGGFGSTGL